jgi:hypothetical protein
LDGDSDDADDGVRGEDDRDHHGRCGRAHDIHRRLYAVTKGRGSVASPGESRVTLKYSARSAST